MLEIKTLTDAKIHEIVDNFREMYFQSIDTESLYKKIAENAVAKGVFCDEELIGYIAYYRNNTKTLVAFITIIAVKPPYRRKGIALMLLNEAINDCRAHGFHRLRLEVNNENFAAQTAYRKCGFTYERPAGESSSFYSMEL